MRSQRHTARVDKELKKFAKDCILDSIIEMPMSQFSAYYVGVHYDYMSKGV